MKHILKIDLIALFLVLLPGLPAQETGSLRGTVEDPTGAPIPGATVKLKNTATGEERETICSEGGRFEFLNLPAGDYEIKAAAKGFREASVAARTGRGPSAPLRIALRVAPMAQKVTVTARRGEFVSAEENIDKIDVDDDWFEHLPLKKGDLLGVAALFLEPAAAGAEGAKIFIDGVEAKSFDLPASAINKVYINKNPYSAEFARPGKGRIEVITESGSRQHYDRKAWVTFRNSALDARNAFAAVRPRMQIADFEGEFDGPAGERANFFTAVEHTTRRQGTVIHARTPGGSVVENFVAPERGTRLVGRLDFRLNTANTLTPSYKLKDESERNRGVEGFNLPERAFHLRERAQEVKISERAVLSSNFENMLQLSVKQERASTTSETDRAAVVVLDAFSGGGAQVSEQERERAVRAHNLLTFIKGKHAFRFGGEVKSGFLREVEGSNFGGTFQFSSLEDFAAARPFLFTLNLGNPEISYSQHEFSYFLQDELRLRPNLNLSVGLRHEWQSNLDDYNNFAPRVALAYAPGDRQTVLRLGSGLFYERQPAFMKQQSLVYDGRRIRQVVISNPGFPTALDPQSILDFKTPSIVRIAPDIQAPYLIQAGAAVERKFPGRKNYMAVEYTYLRGTHLYRMRNVNAPISGTGARPDPAFINVNQFESSAISRAHSLTVTFQLDLPKMLEILSHYTVSRAMNNTGGPFSLPADNLNLSGEYGRADFDRRHRFNLVGNFRLPLRFRLGTIFQLASALPLNITTGLDNNRDNVANDRPSGIGRNMGKGPAFASVDARLAREIKLGGNSGAPGLELILDVFNVLNRVNLRNFIGTMSSPFFGRANSAHPARHVQVSLRFEF